MDEEFEFKCDSWKADEIKIKALDASIKHWEDNASGKTKDTLVTSCACCVEFRGQGQRGGCKDCPIAISTGKFFCAGISYELVADSNSNEEFLHFAADVVNELKMIRAKALP